MRVVSVVDPYRKCGPQRSAVFWNKLRGITRPSAERLVQRRRWRRQQGNDRTVRVLVPVDSLSDDVSADASDDISPDTRRLLVDAMAALESAVATLRAQLDRAEAGKEAADRHADRERSRADQAEVRADRAESNQPRGACPHRCSPRSARRRANGVEAGGGSDGTGEGRSAGEPGSRLRRGPVTGLPPGPRPSGEAQGSVAGGVISPGREG